MSRWTSHRCFQRAPPKPGVNRRRVGLWAGLVALVAIGSCAVPGVVERGPLKLAPTSTATRFVAGEGHLAQALPQPRLTVRPSAPLAAQYVKATVGAHGANPESPDQGRRWRLVLEVGQPAVTVEVDYSGITSKGLPVAVGASIWVRYYPTTTGPTDAAFADAVVEDTSRREVYLVAKRQSGEPDLRVGGLSGWAFVVRSMDGQLLGAVFSGTPIPLLARGTAPIGMSAGVGVAPLLDKTLFETVRRTPSGCQAVLRHRTARLEERWPRGGLGASGTQRGARFEASPGTWRPVLIHGSRYQWVVWGASDSPDDTACPSTVATGHLSFALTFKGVAAGDETAP